MDRLIPVLIAVAVIALLFLLLWLGWRGRLKRQAEIAAPDPVPQSLGDAILVVPGSYVATTTEGDWLDRIAVHQLGIRTDATVEVRPEGLVWRRSGVSDFFIPVGKLRSVRTESGMAGKFVEKDGLVVVSWRLGKQLVDTGFRTRQAEHRPALKQAISELVPEKS
ncbi:hypothetical protein LWF01_08650 [Saxibacter everestensis]|uniref:PH domain-containing protein n=1 Tax=Saxibacter everestensis TaxID=2909229 RepID=A0ABY8R035_9MICO|nr:hypothetical protein LWF01_08650 [Brevibacteriaceae bacterium ZFBP1038]